MIQVNMKRLYDDDYLLEGRTYKVLNHEPPFKLFLDVVKKTEDDYFKFHNLSIKGHTNYFFLVESSLSSNSSKFKEFSFNGATMSIIFENNLYHVKVSSFDIPGIQLYVLPKNSKV